MSGLEGLIQGSVRENHKCLIYPDRLSRVPFRKCVASARLPTDKQDSAQVEGEVSVSGSFLKCQPQVEYHIAREEVKRDQG